jgi:hypothetical protein
MTRRALNLLTAAALLVCVATLALWVVSYWYFTVVGFWPSLAQRRAYGLASSHGSFCFLCVAEGNGRDRWAWRHERSRSREPRLVGTAGFTWRHRPGEVVVAVPYWLLTGLLVAPLPALLRRRRRKPVEGECATCGYDLRASPDRCPECGTATPVVPG